MATAPLWWALSSTSATAQIEPRGGLEPPDLLELTGHIGEASAQETGGWNLIFGDRYTRRTFKFHLFGMRILNSGRLPLEVLAAVEPYRPNFYLFPANTDQMKTLEATTPQDRIIISGYRRRGSRNILLTGVERQVSATPVSSPSAAQTNSR